MPCSLNYYGFIVCFANYCFFSKILCCSRLFFIGEEALTERDQKFLEFAQAFEDQFITQSKDEDRTIFETLDLGWNLLKILPKAELKWVKEEFIEQYLPKDD